MPSNAPRRIHTPTLILGVPGSGKTSLFAPLSEYLWETYQRVLLLYSWDGGAIPTGLQKYMKQGLIRFWRVRTRSAMGLSVETTMLATKGYWPRTIQIETGETTPAVELVPPVTTLYKVTCKKTGELLAQLPGRHLIAPTYCTPCKTLHAISELTVTEDAHRSRGFEQVGGVAFDGLTSLGSIVMDHMDEARGAGQIGGEKSAFGGAVISGSVKFGGSNRADYNFAQSRVRQAVQNSQSIPYLVEGPVFTALSMEATDEGNLPIIGAKLPGRAATDEASSWFGNVFEMGRTTDESGREHFTLFLRPFTDPQGRRHLLKTSASPQGLPDKLIDPVDQPWAQANLGLVFRMLDQDLRNAMAETAMPGAPGLAGTPTEYGEMFQVTGGTPAPPVATGELPPLSTTAPSVPPPPASMAAPPVATAPTARRRTRVEPPSNGLDSAVLTPTTTTTMPTPMTAAVPGPPPPGMKPPAKAPSAV